MSSFWFQQNYPKAALKFSKAIFLWLIISLFLGLMYNTFIAPSKTKIITSQLLYHPVVSNYQDSIYISLQLKEFPAVNFEYKNTYDDTVNTMNFIRSINIGDTLSIKVANKVISGKEKNILFSDLVYKDKQYFSSFNENTTNETKFIWIFLLAGTFIILLVYFILDKKGIIEKIKNKYFTEEKTELTSSKDFNEFPE